MYNHEIRARDRKLLIVLEYGELDCAKFLRKNKGSICEGLTFFFRFLEPSFLGCSFSFRKLFLNIYLKFEF